MKLRLLGALTLVAAATAGSLPAQAAPRLTAELIDVHHIRVWKDHAPPASGANCSNDGAASNRYVLTGWAVSGSKTATYNTTTTPSNLSSSSVVSAFSSSFNAWNGAPNINVSTSTSSSTKPTANRSYELMFGRTSGSSLAITYTWRWSDGTIESDVIFGNQFAWGHLNAADGCDENAGNVYDVANIATHEFGHVYGLDHPSGARFETMYAYGFSGETLKRTPTQGGDLAGIAAIY